MSTPQLCTDCVGHDAEEPATAVTFYGDGAGRCEFHADGFAIGLQFMRNLKRSREQAALSAHIANGCPDDGVTCRDCCEHEFDPEEGGMCLNCGDDGADNLAAMIDYATDMARDGT